MARARDHCAGMNLVEAGAQLPKKTRNKCSTRNSTPADPACRCMARVWQSGSGHDQCTRTRVDGVDYCKSHAEKALEGVLACTVAPEGKNLATVPAKLRIGLWCGRVDEWQNGEEGIPPYKDTDGIIRIEWSSETMKARVAEQLEEGTARHAGERRPGSRKTKTPTTVDASRKRGAHRAASSTTAATTATATATAGKGRNSKAPKAASRKKLKVESSAVGSMSPASAHASASAPPQGPLTFPEHDLKSATLPTTLAPSTKKKTAQTDAATVPEMIATWDGKLQPTADVFKLFFSKVRALLPPLQFPFVLVTNVPILPHLDLDEQGNIFPRHSVHFFAVLFSATC